MTSEAIGDKGGDNVKLSGGVRDQEPVVIFSEGVVDLPPLSSVRATDSHLWRVHVITFRGCHRWLGPQIVEFFVVVVDMKATWQPAEIGP